MVLVLVEVSVVEGVPVLVTLRFFAEVVLTEDWGRCLGGISIPIVRK